MLHSYGWQSKSHFYLKFMTNLNWEKIGPSKVVSPIFNGRIFAFADEVRTLAFSKFNPGKNDAIFLETFLSPYCFTFRLPWSVLSFPVGSERRCTPLHLCTRWVAWRGPNGERNSFSKMVAEYRMEIIKRHKIWWIVNSSDHPLRDCAVCTYF